MTKGKIILLNGPSSSGKTTLANALQRKLPEPYYILSIDTFYKMLNRERYFYGTGYNHDMINKLMNYTVKLFSDNGCNVITDRVITSTVQGNKLLFELTEVLLENPVLIVSVECPLFELERREKLRQDRNIGQAKQQYFSMDENQICDVKVNTYYLNIDQCLGEIIAVICKPNAWKAFKEINKMRESFTSNAEMKHYFKNKRNKDLQSIRKKIFAKSDWLSQAKYCIVDLERKVTK